jgi:peptidoglycan/xylan/chitin deacetylase (PgdA/CDA1 family)
MATDEPAPSAEPGEAPPPEIAPVPKMKVALTFDDGPTRGNTEPLLELLASYDARCTFFVIGSRAEAFPDLILAITAGGHTIGNHTYDHKSLKAAGAEVSVRKTNDIVESITGKAPVLLRPPYGAWHKGVAEGFGMRIVLWSVDSRDWELRDGQKAAEIVLRDVREGSIILMHDVKTYSIEGAEIVLRALTERGYEFVPVEELTGYR